MAGRKPVAALPRPPSLSRILKDLEAAGLLARRPDATDSRRSLLCLSPKGTAMVAGAGPFLDRIHREIARRFGPDRMEELLAMLDALERALAEPPRAPAAGKWPGRAAIEEQRRPGSPGSEKPR